MNRNSISNCQAFFDNVIVGNAKDFEDSPTDIRRAFNYANSLFHFHEWVMNERRELLNTYFNEDFNHSGDFKGFLAAQEQLYCFRIMCDVANASKHMVLTHKTQTNLKKADDVDVSISKYGVAEYGVARFGTNHIILKDGERTVDFDREAAKLHEYWQQLLESTNQIKE